MCDHRRSLSVYGTNNLHCERHGVGPSNRGHGGSPPGAVKLRSSRLSQLARCRCGVAGDRTATVCNASSILTQPLRDTRRPARNGCNVSRAWGGGEDTRPPARSNFFPPTSSHSPSPGSRGSLRLPCAQLQEAECGRVGRQSDRTHGQYSGRGEYYGRAHDLVVLRTALTVLRPIPSIDDVQ